MMFLITAVTLILAYSIFSVSLTQFDEELDELDGSGTVDDDGFDDMEKNSDENEKIETTQKRIFLSHTPNLTNIGNHGLFQQSFYNGFAVPRIYGLSIVGKPLNKNNTFSK
ncbi:uncharacterized protein [Onthophagus taurus]|uniref:uncharacterized protein n=1 Tax=Onthophagus taurus TaxID=166361 RepID=UPI0039BE3671